MKNIHIVQKGDTLTKISKKHGVSISELKNINQIKNINKLDIGQEFYLKKEDVLGFQALILDKDRNPIRELAYSLEFDGGLINGITLQNGLSKKIFTESPLDEVKVLIKRMDGTWKQVTSTMSGYGNKLVTLISPSIKVVTKTEKHPLNPDNTAINKHKHQKPVYKTDAKKPPTSNKKELGHKTKIQKTKDGEPLTVVEGDIPDLSFLGEYVGGEVTQKDIEAAAKELNCEPGLIYAIARQESAHSSFITIGGRKVPAILFERHQFSKYSHKEYDENYPDISSQQVYHRTKRVNIVTKDAKGKKHTSHKIIDLKTGEAPVADDIYGRSGIAQYKRLVKAYQLNKDASLMSCSWGKFQIMGFNFKAAGYATVQDFVIALSSGDPAHIKAFLKFAKSNKKLLHGLQNNDFEDIAQGHNGASWRTVNPEYASNLEKFYNEYQKNDKAQK